MDQDAGMDMAQKMALFRFTLIAPVIQGTLSEPSAMAYYRRVTEKPLTRPDGSHYHYSPKTLEKWTQSYMNGGLSALIPKERRDKGCVRVISEQAIAEIFRIKEKFPRLGAVQIRLRLIEQGLMPTTISERTLQRFLKTNHLKFQASTPLKDRKAFETAAFGEIWQADTCYFPHIKENGIKRRTYLMCIVDDHSRLITGARLYYEDTAINFRGLLKTAIATYGIPQKLYVDSGSPYANIQLKFICAGVGTLLLHAPIRDGAAKAKVERTFGTLKTRWPAGLDLNQIQTLTQFNDALTNHIRSHNLTLNTSTGLAPMDKYLNSPNNAKTPPTREWLDENFMHRIKRKVKNDATVRINTIQYDAPIHFIGQTVDIHYPPDRPQDAHIISDGMYYPLAQNQQRGKRTYQTATPPHR